MPKTPLGSLGPAAAIQRRAAGGGARLAGGPAESCSSDTWSVTRAVYRRSEAGRPYTGSVCGLERDGPGRDRSGPTPRIGPRRDPRVERYRLLGPRQPLSTPQKTTPPTDAAAEERRQSTTDLSYPGAARADGVFGERQHLPPSTGRSSRV